jgi:hypothetical protein
MYKSNVQQHRNAYRQFAYLKVQRLRDTGFLHLGGQGKTRHREQLRHPVLAFLKMTSVANVGNLVLIASATSLKE